LRPLPPSQKCWPGTALFYPPEHVPNPRLDRAVMFEHDRAIRVHRSSNQILRCSTRKDVDYKLYICGIRVETLVVGGKAG